MRAVTATRSLVERRPAESATPVALAVAYLVAQILDVDNDQTVWAIAVLVAFVPAAVTWLAVTLRRPKT